MNTLKDILKVEGVDCKGYGKIPKSVMLDTRLTIDAKAIYAYFCSYAGAGETAFPGVEKICHDLGIKKQDTYRKHLKKLIECDYIRVKQIIHENGKFGSNEYTLISKPDPESIKNTDIEPSPKKRVTLKKGTRKKGVTNNNKVLESFKNNIQDLKTTTTIPVVVEDPLQEVIKNRIKVTIPEISDKGIEDMIQTTPLEKIEPYLSNWNKFRPKDPAAFFITAVKEQYPIPTLSPQVGNKPANMTGYDQRTYTDDFYESLYE